MNDKHTPGPWTYDAKRSAVDAEYGTIVPLVQWKPNGHLIAAAPEMLAALKEIMAAQPEAPFGGYWERIRMAIDKAEGR